MNTSKLSFSIAILLILAISSIAQGRFNGTVTQIIDGKTVAIEPQPGVRITMELQNIEVPEPGQPLHSTVEDHLKKLALNQIVSFDAKGLSSEKLIGRVFLNGVDLSQQMIRDGAAWYAVADKGTTSATGFEQVYRDTETLARSEKRGVWSIDDLKPAWEFRAEKAEKERLKEIERIQEIQAKRLEERKAAPKRPAVQAGADTKIGIETWFDGPNGRVGNGKPVEGEFGLLYNYDKLEDEGWVETPHILLDVYSGDETEQVMIAVSYDYKGDTIIKGGDVFGIGVGAYGKAGQLLRSEKVEIVVNGKEKIIFTNPKYDSNISEARFSEVLTYNIGRSDLSKIAKSKDAFLIIGKYKAEILPQIREFVSNMLKITAK